MIARLEAIVKEMERLSRRYELGISHRELTRFICELNAVISDLKREHQNEQNL